MDVIWSILSVSFSASMLSASLSSVTTRSVQCGLVRSRTCASRDHKAHTKYIMHTRTHNNVPAEGHCTAMYYDYVSFNQKLRQSGTQPASHPGLYYTFCSAFLSLLWTIIIKKTKVYLFRDHYVLNLHQCCAASAGKKHSRWKFIEGRASILKMYLSNFIVFRVCHVAQRRENRIKVTYYVDQRFIKQLWFWLLNLKIAGLQQSQPKM